VNPQQPLIQLYQQHHGWLRGWLQRRLGNAGDAADFAHDTYLRVIESRQALEDIREPRAFLTTVARRVMVSHLRRREVERAYLDALAHLPENLAPSPEERAIVLETLLEIDRLLDALPAKVRQAFLWAQLDGLSYAEIAARQGVSLSSVKQYMARAIRHCYFPESGA
jgi:RNA polymerase sigma-70 factor (ECF subfamily)